SLAEIGWDIGACPGIEGGECANIIIDCNDIAECLICLNEVATHQIAGVDYDNLVSTSDPGLLVCQRTIGSAEARFFSKQSRFREKWEDGVLAGLSATPCPDLKAASRIAQARDKASLQICKVCGGPDRVCQGLGADRAPTEIGFASTCLPLTV